MRIDRFEIKSSFFLGRLRTFLAFSSLMTEIHQYRVTLLVALGTE